MDRMEIQDGLIRHLPETAFEQALFEALLAGRGCFKTDGLAPPTPDREAHIEPGPWQADGRMACRLIIQPAEFDANRLLTDMEVYPMYFSVVERPYPASEAYRIVIRWELPANARIGWNQDNEWPYFPVLG